jgi:hypothetical protein
MPTPTKKETQKEAIMRILGVSSDEADQILADDKEVDRGKKHEWDLSDAEHKKAMKQANADEHKKPKEPVKRERKANPTKGNIITKIAEFLTENEDVSAENVEITNAERQISFKIGDNCYEITLIAKRKPKN